MITMEAAPVEAIRLSEALQFIDRLVAHHVAPPSPTVPPQRTVDEDHRLVALARLTG
jgi:hypothetical protein